MHSVGWNHTARAAASAAANGRDCRAERLEGFERSIVAKHVGHFARSGRDDQLHAVGDFAAGTMKRSECLVKITSPASRARAEKYHLNWSSHRLLDRDDVVRRVRERDAR